MGKSVKEVMPEVIEFRHRLHRIPELAGKEFKTMKAIRERIAGFGLEVRTPYLETDTVAMLRGGKGPGRNVTLRADIDALALTERTGVPYASEHPGLMHACGHDAHTAMLVGAAEVLASRRDEFAGSIRFVWQPGEENAAMARDLIAAGAIDDPKPDFQTALHVDPTVPKGMLVTRDGAIMASSNHFNVTVKGRGGHGSDPFKSLNPLLAAAAMVNQLQYVVPNRINPQRAGVLSICMFQSGMLENVIPDEAVFAGTMRALDMDSAAELERSLHEICEAVAAAHRVEVEVHSRLAYAVTENDPAAVALARKAIAAAGLPYGELAQAWMGAEDFCYFLQKAPGVYVKLGVGKDSPALHNSRFDTPDGALENGVAYLVNVALAALGE